jgi:hypothetical protein
MNIHVLQFALLTEIGVINFSTEIYRLVIETWDAGQGGRSLRSRQMKSVTYYKI